MRSSEYWQKRRQQESFPRARVLTLTRCSAKLLLGTSSRAVANLLFHQAKQLRISRSFKKLCKQIGLWIVPVGELEGFCKSVGNHGPRWVQEVIERAGISRPIPA